MADLTFSRTTQQMTGASFAGLFGLFAGLCAIFAACATVVDWRDETNQARWPVVSAAVERADVMASVRALKDGGGKTWKLSTRLSFDVSGEARTATLFSRTAYSESEAAKLHAWAAHHRKGSHIDIRYDRSQPNRAVFASPEPGFASERTRSDLILFAIAAIASAGLLALSKYLRAREALAAPAADSASRGGLAVGHGCAAMGLMLVGFNVHTAIQADPFTADNLMGVPAGLMFVFAGILMALPPEYKQWQTLMATLLITCFALTLDWVAFVPGERKFTGSFMGIGFIPGELVGRAFFGFFAVILDIWAIKMWIDECRRVFAPSTSPDASTGQGQASA